MLIDGTPIWETLMTNMMNLVSLDMTPFTFLVLIGNTKNIKLKKKKNVNNKVKIVTKTQQQQVKTGVPDEDELTAPWKVNGTVIEGETSLTLNRTAQMVASETKDTYEVTVDDGHGHTVSASCEVTNRRPNFAMTSSTRAEREAGLTPALQRFEYLKQNNLLYKKGMVLTDTDGNSVTLEITNENVNDVCLRVEMIVPNVLKDHGLCDNSTRISG